MAAARGVLAAEIPVDTATSRLERDRLAALTAKRRMILPALTFALPRDQRAVP